MSTIGDIRRESRAKLERTHMDDVQAQSFTALLRDLTALRSILDQERHDVVRTSVQLAIDEIIAELDHRNCGMLERRMAR